MPVDLKFQAALGSARISLIENLVFHIFRELSPEQKLRVIDGCSEASAVQQDLSLFSELPEQFLSLFEKSKAVYLSVLRAAPPR